VALLQRLSPPDFARVGTHSRFGPLSLAAWIEFFLAHEAHHLYTIVKRSRGLD
jgi:DinB superfamily